MQNKTRSLLLVLTMLLFCGQAIASSILSCCSLLSNSQLNEISHHALAMESLSTKAMNSTASPEMTEINVYGLHHEMDHGLDNATNVGDLIEISHSCEHQCSYCLSLSSVSLMGNDSFLLEYYSLAVKISPSLYYPGSSPESLFRPPIIT